jgi:hypothetical protein
MTTFVIRDLPSTGIEDRLTVVGDDGLTDDERDAATRYAATAGSKELSAEVKAAARAALDAQHQR